MAGDADVTNDLNTGEKSVLGVGVRGEWDGSSTYGSVNVGGYDVLRVDPTNDIPAVSSVVGTGRSVAQLLDDGAEGQELLSIGASVADLSLNAVLYVADPLNFLISAGLAFLVDVVQPLEDLLGLVTGNPERMAGEIAKWTRVGDALGPLADEIRAAVDETLIGWTGKAADAAKQRLHDFADGVASLTNDPAQLKTILEIARTLMEAAQQLVISMIATFIEWLIFTWTPALAAAVPTAGASTAAAGAATAAEATVTTSRVVAFVNRVMRILQRLRLVLYRLHPKFMRRVQTAFQRRSAGRFAAGWVNFGHAAEGMLHDWRTWVPPGVKLGKETANGAPDLLPGVFGGGGKSDEELDEAFDKDR